MTQQDLLEDPKRWVSIRVHAPPEPKGSFFAIDTKDGPRVIPDNARSKKWEKAVRLAATRCCRMHDWLPFDRPCAITMEFFLPRPQKPRFDRPATAAAVAKGGGDWDKLSRSTCDALKGLAYVDDARIVEARVIKRYVGGGEGEGCKIVVEEVR